MTELSPLGDSMEEIVRDLPVGHKDVLLGVGGRLAAERPGHAASLAHQQDAAGNVPGVEAHMEIEIQPGAGGIGYAQRR